MCIRDRDNITQRKVQIAGYVSKDTLRSNVSIGTGITAVDLPTRETILICVAEATLLGEHSNTLFSTLQMRESGVQVDDIPRKHGGNACIEIDDYVIPLILVEGMISMKIRKPTKRELINCEMVELTADIPWFPEHQNEEELGETEYNELVQEVENRKINISKTKKMKEDPTQFMKYFLHPGEEVMKKTLQNTTRFGSINMRIPMRQHYKARNPILQRRRIMEPYATDTWFSTIQSYEGYNCAQIFYGTNSKVTSHYGLRSEQSGPQALLDFFRQEGVFQSP